MATASVWDSEVLDIYFQDISGAVPLPSEEEVRLAKLIHQGHEGARNELVSANLRFVVRVASEYQNCGLPLEDLISAGNVGLIQAAERFDEERGFKFITYAHWWIRQGIYNAITLESRLVRLPANRVKLLNSINKLLKQLGFANVTNPSSDLIAQKLGVSVEMVEDTLMRAQDVCSLDADASDDDHAPINVLSDDAQDSPDAGVIEGSDRRLIERVLNTLEEREAHVLRLHFGLEGQEPRTLARIGKALGLTKERVRQIKEKALSKLRHPRRRSRLDEVRDAK
ncbi:MAG: RNA polymerase sigma factor RpoD/SigA [Candidatus Latescibacteria bacterium]|jgi:RNA polymerase primary sigma factor|nr:RNA polymerase sigma factor RpoD/SigA [Candidatus Latescibacterota bacterium]MBT4138063.1 RNA polymerase sigma factor RpoD/SigA [Candidatus Latescibacterota bacterium]